MSDMYFDIIRRANNTAYNYMDLICPSPPASEAITLDNMRLSLAAGLAFIDVGDADKLTPYVGAKITVTDSAGKKVIGYIKAPGTGETFSSTLNVSNCVNHDTSGFDTFESASAAGFHAVKTTSGTKYAGTNDAIAFESGRLYQIAQTIVIDTAVYCRLRSHLAGTACSKTLTFTSGAGYTDYLTTDRTGTGEVSYNTGSSATGVDVTVSDLNLRHVLTPSVNGVTIVSERAGSTQSWESIEAGFNYYDASGYTIELDAACHVYKCTTPGTSDSSQPAFDPAAGATTTDGTAVWTECNPTGINYCEALTFGKQPEYGNYGRQKKYMQTIEWSAAGLPYVYDHGVAAIETRRLRLKDITPTDLGNLLNFIEIVRGAKYAFNFYDENGAAHRSIILNPNEISSEPSRYLDGVSAENGPELELYLYT